MPPMVDDARSRAAAKDDRARGPPVGTVRVRRGNAPGAFTTIATGPTHCLGLVGRPMAAGDGSVIRPQPSLAVAPNPFSTSTRILYAAPERAAARLVVYDVSGRRVRTLEQNAWAAGPRQVE